MFNWSLSHILWLVCIKHCKVFVARWILRDPVTHQLNCMLFPNGKTQILKCQILKTQILKTQILKVTHQLNCTLFPNAGKTQILKCQAWLLLCPGHAMICGLLVKIFIIIKLDLPECNYMMADSEILNCFWNPYLRNIIFSSSMMTLPPLPLNFLFFVQFLYIFSSPWLSFFQLFGDIQHIVWQIFGYSNKYSFISFYWYKYIWIFVCMLFFIQIYSYIRLYHFFIRTYSDIRSYSNIFVSKNNIYGYLEA